MRCASLPQTVLTTGGEKSIEDPAQDPAQALFRKDLRLKVALEQETGENRSQSDASQLIIYFLLPGEDAKNSSIAC